jgi:MFS family permease
MRGRRVIVRKTVLCLGLSQLILWGITYYLIGGFGELIVADLNWSRDAVYGGFAVALVVMGLTSPVAGRAIDRHGGRKIMILGSLISALGCFGLALSHDLLSYYASWIVLGFAMRLTLYDAAFAALARIGGPQARKPMAQITLLGGLASTTFWPIGHILSEYLGWRGAVFAYAGIALATVPLHLALPNERHETRPADHAATPPSRPLAVTKRQIVIASALYMVVTATTNFLNAGMSAQMIAILSGLGLAASAAVWISTLRGIGQSAARLCEVLFGQRIHPLTLDVIATAILPFCFIVGLFSSHSAEAAIAFALLYGIGNGLITITRGTLPLVLFDHRTYGTFVGQLIAPSFLFSAAAPITYAAVMDRFGPHAALYLSAALATITLLAALALKWGFEDKKHGQTHPE